MLVLGLLYLLGLFVQSQLYGIFNQILLRVPVVTTIYQAVLNVFQALESQRKSAQYKRVVLVEFPQPRHAVAGTGDEQPAGSDARARPSWPCAC